MPSLAFPSLTFQFVRSLSCEQNEAFPPQFLSSRGSVFSNNLYKPFEGAQNSNYNGKKVFAEIFTNVV